MNVNGSSWALAALTLLGGFLILAGCTLDARMSNLSAKASLPSANPTISFGNNGIVRTKMVTGGLSSDEDIYAVALQSDGKMVVAGYTTAGDSDDFALARFNPDGTLDTSFAGTGKTYLDIAGGASDYAYGVAIQPDGKILAAGITWGVGNGDFALVRYNSDGTLDTSFGNFGIVTTELGMNDYGQAIALQSDGKILVGGYSNAAGDYDFAVARYNSDGSLDTSFGGGSGFVLTNISSGTLDLMYSMALQSDGKILLAGRSGSSMYSGYNFAVVRYNTDGSLDTTFGGTGKVVTSYGMSGEGHGLAVQSDGKILLVGSASISGDFNFVAIRYNSDGSLDTSFGGTGEVNTDTNSGLADYAISSTIQSDGKILVAGRANGDFVVLRYNANGSVDTSYGSGGKAVTDFNSSSWEMVYASILQDDGKLIVAGYTSNKTDNTDDFGMVRYNTDGSLDASFGSAGKVALSMGAGSWDYPMNMAVQSDGKIIVVGSTDGLTGQSDVALVRYNIDGSLDTGFGGTGKVMSNISNSYYYPTWACVQSDGKILVTGSAGGGSYDIFLQRYNSDGTLDSSFGGGTGQVVTDMGSSVSDYGNVMALQGDGKILVGGYTIISSYYAFAVVRYNTDGSLDTSFGGTGKVTLSFSGTSNSTVSSMVVQSDGKIVVAGVSNAAGNDDFALARYNSDGSLDTSFGGTGKVLTNFGASSSDFPTSMALQSDGKILVSGQSNLSGNNDFALARYNSDGSLDSSFGSSGKVTLDLSSGSSDISNSVVVQTDGKILLGGKTNLMTQEFAMARFNSDGSLDSTFGTSGKVITDIKIDDYIQSLYLESDGSILAGGGSSQNRGAFTVVKYNGSGGL